MAGLFKLTPAPTFRHSVQITLPGGDTGEISFEFRHKAKDGIAKWMAGSAERSDLDTLCEIIAGWSGVADESGALVPYSPEALQTLISNYPAAARQIFVGYLRGLTEGKEKN